MSVSTNNEDTLNEAVVVAASSSRPAVRAPGRIKRSDLDLERLGQDFQFGVGYATQLSFDFRQRGPAQVPPKNATPSRQCLLGDVLLITQLPHLRPDNVLRFGHAPFSELDPTKA
jgi:hypothetical protein